jgi:GntR family transcriptional regulator, histidine utilization repressor
MIPQGWEAIRDEVKRRIRVRDWSPGSIIPTEAELAAEFGCARGTVNRALIDLARAGVLERRRKAGTRVALLPVRQARFAIPVIRAEIEARGQVATHQVLALDRVPAPVPVAARMGRAAEGHLIHVETLYLADGRPFAHEARWVNPSVLPDPVPDFGEVSANEWLVANVALAEGDISFAAEGADARVAQVLGIAVGAPIFVTERLTRGTEAAITFVRLSHAPGYRMQTAL